MWYNKVNGDASITSMAKTAKKDDAKKSEDKLLGKYLKMFTESWEYAQQNYHETWENNWKLYRNIRTKRNHPGTIETFVPMVNSTVNTIVATLFNSNPTVKYIPNHPDQEADTAVLNEIYQDFARKDGWALKNKINGRQGVITGNYCAYYEWQPDADGGFVHKEIIPVRDMVIDPQSHTTDDARYIGRRFFATKKELKEALIYDAKSGKMVNRYKDIDEITSGEGAEGGGTVDSESDKVKKDQALGATAPGNADMVELIEIWTPERVAVIANRSVLIEERENPHYALMRSKFEQRKLEHELQRALALESVGIDIGEFDEKFSSKNARLLPFAHGCEYQDVSLVYGSSDVDIIADEQELLNTLTELNVEAIMYQLFPERQIDPRYAGKIDDLSPAPGKVYPLPAGAATWLPTPNIPTNAFAERQNIKSEIRESASVSEVSKGISSTDSMTATEIKATLAQADIRIQEKARNLADGFFFQECKICFKLLQLYADDTIMVRTVGDAGVEWQEVDMSRFMGDYTPMVTLDVEHRLEQAEKQEAYTQAYQMIIADPTNNLMAAKEIMYKKMMPELSSEEIKRIITPAEQAPVMGAAPAEENINPEMQDLANQDMIAQDMGVMQDGQMDGYPPAQL
jgi:hypothetical protein